MILKKTILIFIFCAVFSVAYSFSINLDTNEDGKPDKWLELDGKAKWKLYDINGNNEPDESVFFVNKKNQIYVITSQRMDFSGNGKPDIWITNTFKGKHFTSLVKIDSNMDGKVDLIQYKENDVLMTEQTDADFDTKYDIFTEYYSDGKKKKEGNDQNQDGVPDDFYYFLKTGETDRQELDTNFDKKPDYWVQYEYDKTRKLKKCILIRDSNFDGKPDEWHYTNEYRQVVKIEKDTNFDGKPDSVKKFK